jgi:hypothetical protein
MSTKMVNIHDLIRFRQDVERALKYYIKEDDYQTMCRYATNLARNYPDPDYVRCIEAAIKEHVPANKYKIIDKWHKLMMLS